MRVFLFGLSPRRTKLMGLTIKYIQLVLPILEKQIQLMFYTCLDVIIDTVCIFILSIHHITSVFLYSVCTPSGSLGCFFDNP